MTRAKPGNPPCDSRSPHTACASACDKNPRPARRLQQWACNKQRGACRTSAVDHLRESVRKPKRGTATRRGRTEKTLDVRLPYEPLQRARFRIIRPVSIRGSHIYLESRRAVRSRPQSSGQFVPIWPFRVTDRQTFAVAGCRSHRPCSRKRSLFFGTPNGPNLSKFLEIPRSYSSSFTQLSLFSTTVRPISSIPRP